MMASAEFAYDMTVVVPVYNAERYLGRCLASLDVQSARQDSFEVVLVNDGSTDKSLDLCREAVAARPNYVLIDQSNQGVSAARNVGIQAARGRFIMFLDADDALSKRAIGRLVRTFRRYETAVDLLTYNVVYVDVATNAMRRHRRSKLLTATGVYDVRRYPYLAQTTPNVCIRNDGDQTPLFPVGMRMGEDQYFNTQVLAQRGVLGYCDGATYYHLDNAQSSSSQWDEPRYSFEDMMRLYEMLVELAESNQTMADYAYSLVLYNLAWRLKQDKLSLAFGTEREQLRNHERLSSVARAIPRDCWLGSPDLTDTQRVFLMRRYGVVGKPDSVAFTCDHTILEQDKASSEPLELGVPRAVIYAALRTDKGVLVRGFVQSPALTPASGLSLRLTWDGGEVSPVVSFVRRTEDEVKDASQRDAWHFEAELPPMDGKPYMATLMGSADGQSIPAFSFAFDLCRCNGRRINATVREFGDRRLTLAGGALRVGTVKDLPAWTMPVVTRLMRVRDRRRTGDYDVDEVRSLRAALPKALRQLEGTRLWLYVDAPKAYERDSDEWDGVVRLRMEDLQGHQARVAALIGAERVVSGEYDFKRLLPCSYQTWERIADFTVPQVYAYAGEAKTCLLGSPFDE